MAMMASDHGQAGQSAFGRFGLQDGGSVAATPEEQAVARGMVVVPVRIATRPCGVRRIRMGLSGRHGLLA